MTQVAREPKKIIANVILVGFQKEEKTSYQAQIQDKLEELAFLPQLPSKLVNK